MELSRDELIESLDMKREDLEDVIEIVRSNIAQLKKDLEDLKEVFSRYASSNNSDAQMKITKKIQETERKIDKHEHRLATDFRRLLSIEDKLETLRLEDFLE